MYVEQLLTDIRELGIASAGHNLSFTMPLRPDAVPTLEEIMSQTVFDISNPLNPPEQVADACARYSSLTNLGRQIAQAFLAGACNDSSLEARSTQQHLLPRALHVNSCMQAEPRFAASLARAGLSGDSSPVPILVTGFGGEVCAYLKELYEPSGLALVTKPEYGLFAGTIFRPNALRNAIQTNRQHPGRITLETLGVCTPMRFSTFAFSPEEYTGLRQSGYTLQVRDSMATIITRANTMLATATPLSEDELRKIS